MIVKIDIACAGPIHKKIKDMIDEMKRKALAGRDYRREKERGPSEKSAALASLVA